MASSRAALHPPRSEEELDLIARIAARKPAGQQLAAAQIFEAAGLPHRRVEGWRWSDVRAAVKSVKPAKELLRRLPVQAPDEPFRRLADPFVIGDDDTLSIDPDQLDRIGLAGSGGVVSRADAASVSPIAALAMGLASHPGTMQIEIEKPQPGPLRMVFSAGDPRMFHHVSVRIAAGIELEVVETHLAYGGFGNVAIEFVLEKGASVRRTLLQLGAPDAAYAATSVVRLQQDARYAQTILAFGARLARLETHLTHEAGGSHAELNGAYLAGDGCHADLTSHVRHAAPHCTTRQTIKGVARKGGKGVFQGKFLVERAGQKTDADMQHAALLLDEGAEINAKPELEIYADDVACAHGNSIGALDAAALFYIRQRGVPLEEAQAMLIEGFIAEALDASPRAETLMAEARRWLLGQGA